MIYLIREVCHFRFELDVARRLLYSFKGPVFSRKSYILRARVERVIFPDCSDYGIHTPVFKEGRMLCSN